MTNFILAKLKLQMKSFSQKPTFKQNEKKKKKRELFDAHKTNSKTFAWKLKTLKGRVGFFEYDFFLISCEI